MHADKFKFKDPETWKKPESDFEMQDEDLGKNPGDDLERPAFSQSCCLFLLGCSSGTAGK